MSREDGDWLDSGAREIKSQLAMSSSLASRDVVLFSHHQVFAFVVAVLAVLHVALHLVFMRAFEEPIYGSLRDCKG